MEETGCEVNCGAPTTLAVRVQQMKVKVKVKVDAGERGKKLKKGVGKNWSGAFQTSKVEFQAAGET